MNYLINGEKMKRSRLNLFKATSMSISVLGIILIIATLALFAYFGIYAISNSITTDVGSGSAYDQLAVLKSDYNSLNNQFTSVQQSVDSSNNKNAKTAFINAKLELVKANSDINDVESALSAGKSKDEVAQRINAAQAQLGTAQTSLSNVKGMI
jgi:hypothetical protein